MFQMLRSPFMATFLKGGFGLLGLVALTWALQQDVRSPTIFRAQTVWEGYSFECTPYHEVGCTATSFGYEAPCCEYSYDQPLVKRYLNQPCFYQRMSPREGPTQEEGELYFCREEFTCEGSVCGNKICEPGEIDAQSLSQPYWYPASGNADNTDFFVTCSIDCTRSISAPTPVCGNGICEQAEALTGQQPTAAWPAHLYCPQDCAATLASALARQCIYSVAGSSSSSSCHARDPDALCPVFNFYCPFGYATIEGECEYDSRGCPYPRVCAPDMRWNAVGDMKFGTDPIYGVTYGAGKFVAVGYNGKGAYSTDGANWTAMNMAVGTTALTAVTYGDGKFVAVGQSGKGAYSTNGTSWTALSGPSANHLYSVTYGNGKFVAVGAAAGMYSADGINWTRISDGHFNAPSAYKSVTYGNNKFVAVGFDNTGVYSTDGITWTTIGDMKFNASNITSVTFGAGRFVAVGYNGKGAYSDDGVTWTAIDNMRISSTEYNFYGSAYGGDAFMAVGVNGSYSVMGGTAWTPVADMKLGMSAINSVAYGAGKFVAVAQSGKGSYTGPAVEGASSSSSSSSSSSVSIQACPEGYICSKIVDGSDCASLAAPNCTIETSGTCGTTACQGVCRRCASSSSVPAAVGQFLTSITVQTSMESPKFVYSALVTIKNVSSTVATSAVIEVTTPKTLSLRPSLTDKNCKKAYTPSNTIIYGCAHVNSSSQAIPLNPGESKTFRIDFDTSPKPAPFTIRAESKKFVGDGVIGSVAQWNWNCGNNTIDAGEQCDGSATSCSGQSCTDLCQCASVCGNSILETGEQCETMAVAYEAGGAARNMVLGDFIGDSALDIAVLNTTSLGVLPGKGDGTFDAYISTPEVGSTLLPYSLTPDMYAHDMDGDAKLDLVFATDDAITYAKGNGNGTFNIQDLSLSAITGKIKRFAVGNFDASGYPSLVLITEPTADTPMELWYYRGEAGMTFQSPTKIASASVGSSWSYFHSADFDGDGRQDVALVFHTGGGSTATNTLQIYYGNGDGTFTQKSFSTTGHPKSVHDIADDGKLDFYVYDGNFPGGLGVDILLAQQNRTYVQSKLSFTSGNASYFTDVGDFNGDGKQDFYAGVLSQAIYYGNGSQNYTSASAYVRLPYNAMNSPKTLVADLNGDGNTDILSMENRYGGAATPSLIAVYLPSCTSPNVCSNTCNCAAPSVACIAEGQTGVTGGASACCAGLTQLSQRTVSAQNTCESQAGTFVCTRCGAAPLGDGQCGSGENRCNCAADCAGSSSSQMASCGNGIKEGSEQCEQGIACAAIDCFVAPCTQFQCNYETCRCFMPGSSSSTSATDITIMDTSSSSSSLQVPAVCGNAAIEGTEECELGVCCHNGFSCDTRTCACTPLGQVPDQASTCGNYRIEAGEDCEDGITTPQLPCEGTATCNVHTCRCPGGMARCARWRSTP